jgi:hypothetical protein
MGNGVEIWPKSSLETRFVHVTPDPHTQTSPQGDNARSSVKRPVRPEYVPFVQKRFEQGHTV